MRLINRGAGGAVVVVLLGGACSGSPFGGPVALSAFPIPTLTVEYDNGGLVASVQGV